MYENKTPEEIRQSMIDTIDSRLQTMEGSFTGDMLAPVSMEIWKLYLSLSALEPMFYVDETSGVYLDRQAGMFGIIRKLGTQAVCAVHFTGTSGTVVEKNSRFVTPTGIAFLLAESVTLGPDGADGSLIADTIGTRSNIAADVDLSPEGGQQGIDSITHDAAVGGTDPESDEAFCKRFYDFLRRPATSGNGYHYQQWMTAISGIAYARIIKLWDGAGTVQCIAAAEDYGEVDDLTVSAAQDYIDEQKPIGPTVTVQSVIGTSISVSATIEKESSASIENIRLNFQAAIDGYIHQIAASKFDRIIDASTESLSNCGYTVVYNRVAALLVECDGVLDFDELTVNGVSDNVVISYDHIPVLGEVNIDEISI